MVLVFFSGPVLDAYQHRGFGFKSMSFGVGLFSLDGNCSFHISNHVISFKLTSLGVPFEGIVVNIAGVLYEVPLVWTRKTYISMGAGVAYNWGVFKFEGKDKDTVGFPIETKMVFKVSRDFGLGFYIIYNHIFKEELSKNGPFITVGVKFYLGN